MRTALLIAVACVGCAEQPVGSGVKGSRADMTTQPGSYTGYRVVTACTGTWTTVGVVGTGATALTTQDQISLAGQDLYALLDRDIPSVWGGGGYSLACESGVGTSIDLDDWRDVDTAVLRIAGWLTAHDYALQVGISVSSIPVPVAE